MKNIPEITVGMTADTVEGLLGAPVSADSLPMFIPATRAHGEYTQYAVYKHRAGNYVIVYNLKDIVVEVQSQPEALNVGYKGECGHCSTEVVFLIKILPNLQGKRKLFA